MFTHSQGAQGNGVTPTFTEENNNKRFWSNLCASRAQNSREFSQASTLNRPPSPPRWQAPANFYDDIDTDDSRSTISAASDFNRNFRQKRVPPGQRWKPPAHFLDDGDLDDTQSIASSSCSVPWSEIRASMRRAEAQGSSFRPNLNDPNAGSESSDDEPFGGRMNLVYARRARRETPQLPCFGNALPDRGEDGHTAPEEVAVSHPLPRENASPNITISNPNTTMQDEQISLSAGPYQYNARNMYIDFTEVAEKPMCGAEPVIDVKNFQKTLSLSEKKEWRPSRSDTGSSTSSTRAAMSWEQMDCRNRRYPWIADVIEMYQTPTENRDIFKECEAAGRFLVVEQFHDDEYDYVKCWILNTEFPMRMMIAPYWCFPGHKPKVGSYYDGNFHLVLHKIGPYNRRKILRLKAGATVYEDKRPQSRFLGKLVRLVHSEGCWAKILKMHVRLLFTNTGEDMQTYYFGKLIWDKSQALTFPEGAHSIEGVGWIEPLPGAHGTSTEPRGMDVKLFYLTGKFAETVIQWDDPYPTKTHTEEESHAITQESRKVLDKTRYEWQPRNAASILHKKTKRAADEPPRIVPSKNKFTKTQRILLSIEMLRKIRARKSVFAQLNPEKVFALECIVGDREVASKSRRLRELTMKLCEIIENQGAYNWIKEREPDTIKDVFDIIKMNVNYLPQRTNSVAEWLRPVMFPEEEDSDYEKWD